MTGLQILEFPDFEEREANPGLACIRLRFLRPAPMGMGESLARITSEPEKLDAVVASGFLRLGAAFGK